MKRYVSILCLLGFALLTLPAASHAAQGYSRLDEMSLERWAKLRETERYQMKIAEELFTKQNYQAAADEYEKFVTLYEASEGAPFAQHKWAMCQVKLKKLNTAVKDGYQTVIDYWPDSPEAVAAAYLIGKTYKDMGDLGPAKQAYLNVTTKHGDEMVAVLARLDLADIARIEQDRDRRVSVLKELVFNAPRVGDAGRQVAEASGTLAQLMFEDGSFIDGKNALATTYKEPNLSREVVHGSQNRYLGVASVTGRLVATSETKDKGIKLADAAISYLREQMPAAPKDDAEKSFVKSLTYNMADLHSAAGRPEETSKIYEKMLVDYQGEDDVFDRYAGWLKGRSKRDEARILYGRMKNLNRAQGRIAYSYVEEQKYDLAIAIYQGLLSTDAKFTEGRWDWTLAETYQRAGKYKEAIAAFQQCDNFPENLFSIASCYRAMKQHKEAIGTYTQIIGAYETRAPQALLQLAYTHEAAGAHETAIATLQQVCKRYPGTGESAQAHQHLNNRYKITITFGGEAKAK